VQRLRVSVRMRVARADCSTHVVRVLDRLRLLRVVGELTERLSQDAP
jgi:hypothetical protein